MDSGHPKHRVLQGTALCRRGSPAFHSRGQTLSRGAPRNPSGPGLSNSLNTVCHCCPPWQAQICPPSARRANSLSCPSLQEGDGPWPRGEKRKAPLFLSQAGTSGHKLTACVREEHPLTSQRLTGNKNSPTLPHQPPLRPAHPPTPSPQDFLSLLAPGLLSGPLSSAPLPAYTQACACMRAHARTHAHTHAEPGSNSGGSQSSSQNLHSQPFLSRPGTRGSL